MERKKITDDLHALQAVIPPDIIKEVEETNDNDNLLEVILDLGRIPTARFMDREVELSDVEVTHENIKYVVERIGDFDTDNRAGLHPPLRTIAVRGTA